MRIIKQTKIYYVDSLIELRDGSVLMGCARGELGLIKQNSDEILYLNVGLKQMSIIRTLLSIDEHTFIFENDKDNLLRIYSY